MHQFDISSKSQTNSILFYHNDSPIIPKIYIKNLFKLGNHHDESVLWSESIADGYRAVRMVSNIHLNVNSFHGDKRPEGVLIEFSLYSQVGNYIHVIDLADGHIATLCELNDSDIGIIPSFSFKFYLRRL